MTMRRFSFLLCRLLPAVLTVSLGAASPCAGAEPSAPPLAEQLARAQTQHDAVAVAEICRRELDRPGSDASKLLVILCRAQIELKDGPGASETLERLRKVSPPPAATVAELRGDLLRVQDKPLDESLTAWREAVGADPDDLPGLQGKIADALDQAGRWEEAAGQFRAVLRLVPGHAARQARLAVCLLNAGHAAEADKEMQAATLADASDETVKAVAPMFDRLHPQLATLSKLEARVATGKQGDSSAFDVSSGANTAESASLDRAVILYRAEAYAGALVDATRAVKLTEKRSLAARLLQAQCLWRLGQEKEAAALGVAKMSDKKWFDNTERFNRLRKADLMEHISALQTAAKLRTVRATVMLEADQPTLALEEAKQAHEFAKSLRYDDTEVVYAAASLLNGEAAEALAAAKRATEYAPKNPDGWAVLGRVEQETRADFAAAAEHLSKALSLREEPRWLQRREFCLRTLGRTAEADRDAQRLARLQPAS